VQVTFGSGQIALSLRELIPNIDVLYPAENLIALDTITLQPIELDDSSGDTTGKIYLGRFDNSNGLDGGRVRCGPNVTATQVITPIEQCREQSETEESSNESPHHQSQRRPKKREGRLVTRR
jgi:hypothetical protein